MNPLRPESGTCPLRPPARPGPICREGPTAPHRRTRAAPPDPSCRVPFIPADAQHAPGSSRRRVVSMSRRAGTFGRGSLRLGGRGSQGHYAGSRGTRRARGRGPRPGSCDSRSSPRRRGLGRWWPRNLSPVCSAKYMILGSLASTMSTTFWCVALPLPSPTAARPRRPCLRGRRPDGAAAPFDQEVGSASPRVRRRRTPTELLAARLFPTPQPAYGADRGFILTGTGGRGPGGSATGLGRRQGRRGGGRRRGHRSRCRCRRRRPACPSRRCPCRRIAGRSRYHR